MARDGRKRARDLFMAIADLPEAERAAALAKECGGDAALQREVEALLRADAEGLAIREKTEPDAWKTFNTRSLLGGALLGRKKLGEAEPLLLDGYRGMKEREASIPPPGATRIPEALERLVRLYEAKGNATEAAAWRHELEAARATESRPATRESKR
jgi:hypothetical protein